MQERLGTKNKPGWFAPVYVFMLLLRETKAVAKEILMRISNEGNLHTSDVRGQSTGWGHVSKVRQKQEGAVVTLNKPL